MQFAIAAGVKSEAKPNCEGICQCCGNRVIAKCGALRIWHWAHVPERMCDKWWEPETEWHRKWKSHFPVENQEVIHFDESTGEKHIADIKTKEGIVIELQNSSIRYEEIQSREAYYKNMVWVLNGETYRNRFTIMDRMPSPKAKEMEDILIMTDYNEEHYRSYALKSENEPNATMVIAHPYSELKSIIDRTYRGDHLFAWKSMRKIWFMTTKPVFIDFGDTTLYELLSCQDGRLRYVRLNSKKLFIENHGGSFSLDECYKGISCRIGMGVE